MESPQPPARPPPSPTASCQSDAAFLGANDSFQPENDSFSSSQQCSADPNAFLGFHVAPSAENVELEASQTLDTPKKTEKRLQLVLDLEVREQGATRGPDFEPIVASSQSESQAEMRNQFSDLFAKDTQDEEQVAPQAFSPLKNQDMARDKAPPSPPPTILKDVESARKAKIRQVAAAEEKKQEIDEELAVGASGLSEYSEDLAPNCFQAAFTASLSSLDAEAKSAMITEGNSSDKADESDRETNFEDEMECTQALDEDDGAESECVTRVDDTGTEAYSLSDAGTQPYDFTFNDDDDKMEGEQKDDADITCCEESEDTSGDGSQIKVSDGKLDYLTPRANVTRVEKPAAGNATSEVTAPIHRDDNEPELDDDRDEYTATQPSEDCATDEPLEEPTSSADENSLKKGDNTARDKRVGAADSQTKAIRALEFSFTSTGSHENEVQFDSSLSGSMTLTSNTNTSLPRSAEANPFETSISPVCAPTPTPVDDSCTPEDIIVSKKVGVLTKRKESSDSRSGLLADRTKQNSAQSTESLSQTSSTSSTKRRKRETSSPDGRHSDVSDPQTPRPPVRRTTRSSQSTPSSTPSIRTRAKILSPLPINRVYSSRSQTIFKYKFEFCLTGFVGKGEETLVELIKEHGGKIPDRYQDVLYKGNAKAVVIGSPIAWRKRKFMQAVACGFPVIHPEWVHKCVDAGKLIPFDRYHVPSGYSVSTRKFECLPSRELHIFEGYSFGIVCNTVARDKVNLYKFILEACGADAVDEEISIKGHNEVDIVLCDEYTKVCQYYEKKRNVPVKDFQWITECMILQRFLDPDEPGFEPQRVGRKSVSAASAEIGDSEKMRLKLHTGELVLADVSGNDVDHFLLYNVCEIMSIHVNGRVDDGEVMLRVGILKRDPYSTGLYKIHTRIVDIPASQVKRRVLAVSKEAFDNFGYRDESIFYFENEDEDESQDVVGQQPPHR